nr:ankyrin repeat domain-containing protein [Wolbachia endosymbiont of Cimex lectularius]
MYAYFTSHFQDFKQVLRSLIGKGANVHVRNAISGDKPIQSATVGGHKNIVGFFLNKEGISINDADNGGRTLLHLAAMYDHLETIKFLVGKGANIYAKSNFNYKPIHHAITNGYENIVEFFIDIGIDVNDADRDGWTLLHYAADCGQLEIVRLLTDKGANIYAKDNSGLIPSDLARGRGYMRVVDILGGTKKKSRETTSDNPELYLSGVTVKKQPMRTRAPGN